MTTLFYVTEIPFLIVTILDKIIVSNGLTYVKICVKI